MSGLLLLGLGFIVGYWVGTMRASTAAIEPLDPDRLTPEVTAQVDAAIDRGEKIEAIRIARKATGAGLAETKKYVDARHRSRRPGDPIER